ncbi:ABC transporter ATP-binding protein [Paenibacillus hamazuiensis]|uniref:ABC transporter ATP-binding protein n=1 Tax=Paenibacillus hamazuiensis TaxID=2936508 RepID=UPI00200BC3EA|nr:ABC transporter ATP-binding protein [Paenibacillus hamazuiensis]
MAGGTEAERVLRTDAKQENVFWKLLSFARPFRLWLLLTIAASLVNAVADMLAGNLIREVTDKGFGGLTEFYAMILQVIVLTVVTVAAKYVMKYGAGRFSSLALRDIRETVGNHIASLPARELEKRHSGDFVSRMNNDVMMLQSYFESSLSEAVYRPLVFIGTFAYLLWLNWMLLAAAMVLIPLTIHLANKVSRPINEFTKKAQEGESRAAAVAVDAVSGVYVEKAFNLTQLMQQKYNGVTGDILEFRLKEQKQLANLAPYNMTIRLIPFLCCALLGGYLAVKGQLSAGSLFAFVYLLQFLTEPLAMVPGQIAAFRQTMVAAKRLFEILDLPVERTNGDVCKASASKSAIAFHRVAFAYNPDAPVLADVSFTIPAHKMTALVGASGGGKSTILKLICGFYEPQRGAVELYGKDLQAWDLAAARSYISLVSQEAVLFPMTVAENIALGRPGATLDEIIEAAKAAYAHEFIMKLPEGYQSMVGERGSTLSGGEKQRLSLARAVLKDAPILLLDEPTSALDAESETYVQEAFLRITKGRTVLVIAHRLSTIRSADEVMVLHQGVIAERGTHEELLARNGLYTNLYVNQIAESEGGNADEREAACKR